MHQISVTPALSKSDGYSEAGVADVSGVPGNRTPLKNDSPSGVRSGKFFQSENNFPLPHANRALLDGWRGAWAC